MIDLSRRGNLEADAPLWRTASERPSSPAAPPQLPSLSLASAVSWSHQVHSHRQSKVSCTRKQLQEVVGQHGHLLPPVPFSALRGSGADGNENTRCFSSSSPLPMKPTSTCSSVHRTPHNLLIYQSAGNVGVCQPICRSMHAAVASEPSSSSTRISSTYTNDKASGNDEGAGERQDEANERRAAPTLYGCRVVHIACGKSRRRPLTAINKMQQPISWTPGNPSGGGSFVAALALLLLLSNCLDLLPLGTEPRAFTVRLGQAINLTPSGKSITMSATVGGVSTTSANTNNNNHRHQHNIYARDEESDQPPVTQLPPTVDEPSILNENENFTQIPLEPQGAGQRGGNHNKRLPTTTSTRRPSGSSKRPQVTETDLLPFSDFNVHQPAFSDLIRSYPPTTGQQQLQRRRQRPPPTFLYQREQKQSSSSNSNNQLHHYQPQPQWSSEPLDEFSPRNHLNEDLDDTVVTADQSFEQDQLAEPPTWINYLGDLGDYIFLQLRQYFERTFSAAQGSQDVPEQPEVQQQAGQLPIEMIDEILDDYYYDQYENSQVLYYGAQLVREGDIFEIGCYLPSDHKAEWTKSGRLLGPSGGGDSPRVIRRTDFLGAKQNFSLKVFEASMADSGNYRCDQMSRKYHKLVVAPRKTTTTQLYLIQQRLLSIVNPQLVTSGELGLPVNQLIASYHMQRLQVAASPSAGATRNQSAVRDQLLPSYLIIEHRPLWVSCNISDEFVLRRLRDTPHFQLAWFKNGKQLRNPQTLSTSQAARSRLQQQSTASMGVSHLARPVSPRVQFLGLNGRQLYISSAQYTDAGEYLCSWSKLPVRSQAADSEEYDSAAGNELANSPAELDSGHQASGATISNNLLAAGRLVQLKVPVKLRPFKSTYHVHQGNELRILCQASRGYPAAQISWYVGNRLVDGEFLRENGRDFRLMNLQNQNQVVVTSDSGSFSSSSGSESNVNNERHIVEINPIPSNRHQMQLTADGRGQWVEYRDPKNEKYAIETPEQQLRYMKQKSAQLNGLNSASHSPSTRPSGSTSGDSQADLASGSSGDTSPALLSQTSLSMLVIKSLDIERHSSRYACRANGRANTDEVTTVIQVEASLVRAIKPTTGRATLIPGQDLNFQCASDGPTKYQYIWYKRNPASGEEERLEPNDDIIEIHNERLTLHKPTAGFAGDYVCKATKDENDVMVEVNASAVIQARTLPYIEDFGLDTSHTGKSGIVTDGDRLELTCTISDTSQPVNITWLRSMTPDEEKTMVPLPDTPKSALPSSQSPTTADPFAPTFVAPDQNIIIESLSNHSKRLVIESVSQEHRSYYVCMADNGVTERTRKIIFIRVKDKLVALWPFLGIVAELFILFTIIHIWETQRAYKQIQSPAPSLSPTGSKRPASGASVEFESVPLTRA